MEFGIQYSPFDIRFPVLHVTAISVAHSTACRFRRRAEPSFELDDVSGATPDTAGGTPALPYKMMHGLWGMGQMMFTKYIIVVDADVDMHNTSEALFRLCANTDSQRDSIFTKGPAEVLDHATSEIAMGTKLGIDATRKIAGEGFNLKTAAQTAKHAKYAKGKELNRKARSPVG